MLRLILSFLSGPLTRITEKLVDARLELARAQTDKERIAAEAAVRQLEARERVLIAEQGHWMTQWIRPAFAAPFVIYNAKIIIWDKVLGLGATDGLSAEYWQLQMVVFGAYFLARPFEKRR